ncbi:uncharacterized protein K460DRAFT_416343 [Cucurbitaria berberidis CBS 394.84]|uniref:Uncharacterized protein n=1 Tax=Cucurbitaria berberidis CBS 394.84 TaxID=1168544 RepID=A0A9P4GGG8_9PLEO|nr:uncharacterized protein K460DRAFT_416343 [Cucurbitaria berberidis CBS 394.84]KAF1845011.1 hypothetical protein K460DRAFT_416343 [Cucurbitaria berberidis CBS 394.84]
MGPLEQSLATLGLTGLEQDVETVSALPSSAVRGASEHSTQLEELPSRPDCSNTQLNTVSEVSASSTDRVDEYQTSDTDRNGQYFAQLKNDVIMDSSTSSDAVICGIHDFIQEERRRSFHFLAKYSHRHMDQKDLLSASLAGTDDIENVCNRAGFHIPTMYDGQWYTFAELQSPKSVRHTVAIKVLTGHEPIIDNMTVFHFNDDNAYLVSQATTWLRETYDWHSEYELQFTEMQYEEQRMWWKSNGNSFRLLDLPSEMREAIYLHIIGPVVAPDLAMIPTKTLTLGSGVLYDDGSGSHRNRDPDIERPNMTIMRVSKQVRNEAMEVAYRDTTKRFCALGARHFHSLDERYEQLASVATIWTSIRSFSPHASFLRNIQLEMSAAMFFRFIGIHPIRHVPLYVIREEGPVHVNTLKTFPALQNLDFRFFSPKHKNAVCPWARALGTDGNDPHSCQKEWIDYFFVFAWDALRGLNETQTAFKAPKCVTYSLSGCVKNSTRKHWQHLLNDKRVDHTPKIKSWEEQIRLKKTNDGIIPCSCSTSCAVGGPPLFQCSEHEVRRIEGLQTEMDKYYWDFED